MDDQREPISINSSTIAVAGVGGLGMMALVVIIAATFAVARWLLAGGAVGGVILAAILILRRRNRHLGELRGDLPIVLFSPGVQRRNAEAGALEDEGGRIEAAPQQHWAVTET